MKTYTLAESDVADDQKTITISETKETTSEERLTIGQLKQSHTQKLTEIKRLKVEADLIVDKLVEIDKDEGIALTVKEIPTKLVQSVK